MAQNYYCKLCGMKYPSISSLTAATCSRSPVRNGKHVLYEGAEKSSYVCKHCGMKYPSLSSLTGATCSRHPNKGKHEPAL